MPKRRNKTSNRRRSGSRTGRSTHPSKAKSEQRSSLLDLLRSWWWIAAIAVLVVLAVVLFPRDKESTPLPATSMPANLADRENMYQDPPDMQIDETKDYVATISTAKGKIVVRLVASAAPQTVNNFVFLSRQGFYDNLTFHRVESGFVIQGGDPAGTGAGGPGYTIPAEINLLHVEGAIAMARRGDQVNPERVSSGSQFYITLAPTPFLDGQYTAFGQVIEGMDVVRSIAIGDLIDEISIAEE